MSLLEFITLPTFFYAAGGGLLGYSYYRFIGCKSGTCPITRNPFISILYGATIGLLWALR